MTTVFIPYEDGLRRDEDGLYRNEDGLYRNEDGRRHNKAPKFVLDIRICSRLFLLQAILREFKFSGMSVFLYFTCRKNCMYPLPADFVFSVVNKTGLVV